MSDPKCPRCGRLVSADETIEHVGGKPAHADCRQPRGLSYEERTLLYWHCRGHAAARCLPCGGTFRQQDLVMDVFRSLMHLCPRCGADLSESLRGHLYTCPEILPIARQRAQEARDAARRLVQESSQSLDFAEVLVREADAALAALRATMRPKWVG